MNNKQRQIGALLALFCAMGLNAQVVNNGGLGDYRLTLSGNAPRSFTIGGQLSVAPFAALTVRGDQMGGTSVTPEVFRTMAPTTANTYWRMFQGGTTAGFERGQLFADPANSHFNINAPNGALRLHTNTTQRVQVWPTQLGALPLLGGSNVPVQQDVKSPQALVVHLTTTLRPQCPTGLTFSDHRLHSSALFHDPLI